jgi:pimeloyl-ACP methyl ester carboxylesterase
VRARLPDVEGYAERDGVKLAYEVHGADNAPTVLLMPCWSIIHSRFWKLQVPYLSRHFRVVTFDGRGCGRSDRPSGAAAYADAEYVADAISVLDATGTDRATVVGLSAGAAWGVLLAAHHPERVAGLMAIAAATHFDQAARAMEAAVWQADIEQPEGWEQYNRGVWMGDRYSDFVDFFFAEMFPEPHSSKVREDAVGWAHELTSATLADTTAGRYGIDAPPPPDLAAACAQIRCEVLVVHGTDDRICGVDLGRQLAEASGAPIVKVDGFVLVSMFRITVVV